MYKILFFGDIIGSMGRKATAAALAEWREVHKPDLVIANVENLSHGRGISSKTLLELDALGMDAYTSGNHVWENAEGLSCFNDPRWSARLIRPANIRPGNAGRGWMTLEKDGVRTLVINLAGNLFMKDEGKLPFTTFDEILAEAGHHDLVLVDFHAETTSEKEALGLYADGRATAILGTHTHVPTADEKLLPEGTAYITDIGRVGGHHSVVGFEKNGAIKRFLEPETKSYDPQISGLAEVNAVIVTADPATGKAMQIDRLRKIIDI